MHETYSFVPVGTGLLVIIEEYWSPWKAPFGNKVLLVQTRYSCFRKGVPFVIEGFLGKCVSMSLYSVLLR